jgi:NADP-reducing hydrogenase subunit HndB
MAKMRLDDLRQLREKTKKDLNRRNTGDKDITIIVGMGTCGIAAGAKETLSAFLESLEAEGVDNAVVKQTGCMGLCYVEPTVEVRVPNMPDTIYGNVDPEVAGKIVRRHIKRGELVDNHVFDRPAEDIMESKGE